MSFIFQGLTKVNEQYWAAVQGKVKDWIQKTDATVLVLYIPQPTKRNPIPTLKFEGSRKLKAVVESEEVRSAISKACSGSPPPMRSIKDEMENISIQPWTMQVKRCVVSNLVRQYISEIDNANSQEPLTPNHILTGKASVHLPPSGEFVREDLFVRKRWRRVQYLIEQLWSRWKGECLAQVALRQKWHGVRRNILKETSCLLRALICRVTDGRLVGSLEPTQMTMDWSEESK